MNRGRTGHFVVLAGLGLIILVLTWQGFSARLIPPYSDTWDYLQLARQIHSGHGFSSLFTYPIFSPFSGEAPFPLLWRPPLYPLLLSGAFFFTGGPSILAPILLQSIAYLLSIFGTYLLALTFLESGWALLAALVVALSPDMLGIAEPGIATIPFTAMLTFAVLAAVRGTTRRDALISGAGFGFLMLLRSEAVLLLPAMMWLLWAGERGDRERRIWIFVGAAIVLQVPWAVRTAIVTGRPFFPTSSLVYVNTSAFPGWESSRRIDMLSHSALLWALTHLKIVSAKAAKNFYFFSRQALLLPLPALAPFVWAAMGRITRVGRESAYCSAILLGLLAFIILLSPLEYSARFLHPFIPLVTVVGVILLARMRERFVSEGRVEMSRRAAYFIASAVLALAALELVGALVRARKSAQEPAGFDPAAVNWSEVARNVPADRYALADHPSVYAWYTARPFMLVPVEKDFDAVAGTGAERRAVVLLRDRPDRDPTGIALSRAIRIRLENAGYRTVEAGPLDILTPAP